jgi:dipeptide/tripeptide permease
VSFDPLGDLNWLAVLVAAIAYFAIGAAWYAPPVLGRIWMEAGGMAMPDRDSRPGAAIYVTPLIGSVLSAIALGLLAAATGTDSMMEGIALGLVVAIGFAVPISLVTAQFESQKPKPMVWGAVNAGYHVVGNLVAAIIIASWR